MNKKNIVIFIEYLLVKSNTQKSAIMVVVLKYGIAFL